jgi:transposase
MRQRQFTLTERQANELLNVYYSCQDVKAKTRYQAVRLYGRGYTVKQITEICGCSRPSLMEWCRAYRHDGVSGLIDHRRGGNRAMLTPSQIERLQTSLDGYTPQQLLGQDSWADGPFWTVADLAKLIEREYQVSYKSDTSYRALLDKCDFSYQRPARQYRSRSEAKVIEFEEALEKQLLDIAQDAPDTVILAEDEATLYLQATTKAVWYWRGETPVIKSDPGRACVHFYGTLDLRTGQETVMQASIMNAETTASYLGKLLLAYPTQRILLFWDRAPWHRGPAVQAILDTNPRLQCCFFPTAAPDLNPQEHVWKAAREAVSHNHVVAKLDTLADRFETYLKSTKFPCSLLENHGYDRICMMFR